MNSTAAVNQPCVIIAGKYFGETGMIASVTAGTAEVRIASPKHHGEYVTVRLTSIDLF